MDATGTMKKKNIKTKYLQGQQTIGIQREGEHLNGGWKGQRRWKYLSEDVINIDYSLYESESKLKIKSK